MPPPGQLVEGRVPAKQLVPAHPGDHNLEPQVVGRLAHQPGIHSVNARLVHGVENPRQVLRDIGVVNPGQRMVRSVMGGNLRGQARLVLVPTPETRQTPE